MTYPLLPPELEYDILLLAYRDEPQSGKTLILVAKRVFDWLIPHIFDVVRLSSTNFFPIRFNETTFKKYGHHVRHLLIDQNSTRAYISLFPNVINLAFWAEYSPIYLLSLLQLPLQRLSAGSSMFAPEVFQLFGNLTHLDYIPFFYPNQTDITNVLYLPKLTHLCVVGSLPTSSLRLFLDRARCPQLRVAAIWSSSMGEVELDTDTDGNSPVDDERVVKIKCHANRDWDIGARGGVDTWAFAERVVEERRAGKS